MDLSAYFRNLPILEEAEFRLRPVVASDLPALWEYLKEPPISEFTTWEHHPDPDTTRAYLEQVLGNYASGRVENWGLELKSTSTLVGMVGFGSLNPLHRNGEVGYVLSRHHWGKGLMTTALRLVAAQGFGALGLNKIIARCIAENVGSRRVLEKAGFRMEGLLRKQFIKRGTPRDIAIYGLLEEEYGA